jgi:hypothetical protein
MPFKEYIKDFSDINSRSEFEEILSRSTHSFDLSQVYFSGVDLDWEKKEIRESAYEKVGQYIAKQSQVLLALWDGKENESIGGTASIINYKLNGIEDDKNSYENSLGQIEGGLVYHLLTPRKGDKNCDNAATLKIYCPPFWKEVSQANIFYHKIFNSINTFNRDIIHFQNYLIKAKPLLNQNLDELYKYLDIGGKSLFDHFNTTDYLAQRFKLFRTRALRLLLSFVVVAFALFHIYLSIYPNIILLSLYPILLAIGALIYWRAKRRGYEIKYEDYRSLSEALRVQIFWNLNGNKENVSDYLLQKHKGELEWIKYALRNWTLEESIKPRINIEEKNKDKNVICSLLASPELALIGKITLSDYCG